MHQCLQHLHQTDFILWVLNQITCFWTIFELRIMCKEDTQKLQ